jgi:hypothetical protein
LIHSSPHHHEIGARGRSPAVARIVPRIEPHHVLQAESVPHHIITEVIVEETGNQGLEYLFVTAVSGKAHGSVDQFSQCDLTTPPILLLQRSQEVFVRVQYQQVVPDRHVDPSGLRGASVDVTEGGRRWDCWGHRTEYNEPQSYPPQRQPACAHVPRLLPVAAQAESYVSSFPLRDAVSSSRFRNRCRGVPQLHQVCQTRARKGPVAPRPAGRAEAPAFTRREAHHPPTHHAERCVVVFSGLGKNDSMRHP